MIPRTLADELIGTLKAYPSVTLTGPRQAGKTTLAKWCCPEFSYASLEDPEIRLLAESDPTTFFDKFPEPLIIDEVQRVPDIVSSIQVRIDQDRKRLKRFCEMEPRATGPLLVYDGESYASRNGVKCANFRENPFAP